ncbi:MAG: hypothetical protein HY675_15590 [Chloroflexi bacterium]|nr:hypothetical protein [Chloroflexota bacterium]
METKITATELSEGLSDIPNRVLYRGEKFVIEHNGDAIAVLAPAGPVPGVTAREVAKRLGDIALPGDSFADDLEAAQASQPRAEAPDWRN